MHAVVDDSEDREKPTSNYDEATTQKERANTVDGKTNKHQAQTGLCLWSYEEPTSRTEQLQCLLISGKPHSG